jgi:hypothetical protein
LPHAGRSAQAMKTRSANRIVDVPLVILREALRL